MDKLGRLGYFATAASRCRRILVFSSSKVVSSLGQGYKRLKTRRKDSNKRESARYLNFAGHKLCLAEVQVSGRLVDQDRKEKARVHKKNVVDFRLRVY